MMGWFQKNRCLSIFSAVLLAIAATALALAMGLAREGGAASAAEQNDALRNGVHLLMIEDPGCPYCARWHREVGEAYAASSEGKFAPLVRRHRNAADIINFRNIVFSPTFIIVQDGVEIDRIVGYPGPDFFWGLLGRILERAGFKPGGQASEDARLLK